MEAKRKELQSLESWVESWLHQGLRDLAKVLALPSAPEGVGLEVL